MVRPVSPWIIELSNSNDDRGLLAVLDKLDSVAFKVKRIFLISEVPEHTWRGKHAHKNCWQLLIPLGGNAEVNVVNSRESKQFLLKSSASALCVPPCNWVEFKLTSKESALIVLASEYYDPSDYIFTVEDLNEE